MISTLISLLFAFALFLLSGRLFLLLVDPAGELRLGAIAINALGFLLGLGFISLQLFFYSVLGIGISSVTVTLPWLIILCLLLLVYKFGFIDRRASTLAPLPRDGWGPVEIVSVIIIAVQLFYSLLYSTTLPVTGWDAWSIWFLKARAFFVDGGVTPAFLLDASYGYDHPDYPLLVPLSIMWLFTTLGEVNDIAAKILYPVQFAALLSIVYYFVKRSVGRRAALVATAVLSLSPLVIIHAAGLPVKIGGLYSGDFVGYADLILSLFFVAAGGFIYLYAKDGCPGAFRVAAVLLAIGAWTKNEGLVFAMIGALLLLLLLFMRTFSLRLALLVYDIREHESGDLRPLLSGLLFMVAVFVLFMAPWATYKVHFGLGSEYTVGLNIGTLTSNIVRLPLVVGSILAHLFTRISLVNVAWWLLLLSLIVNIRGLQRPGVLALILLLVGQFAVYALVYIITPADVSWQISTSLDRLVLHLLPLAILIAAINGGKLVECDRVD